MEIKDISGVYNIGKRRFVVNGEYLEAINVYEWTFDEVDENNKGVLGNGHGNFYTNEIPYMSEIFDKLMEAIGR